jgi:hypothetical protein
MSSMVRTAAELTEIVGECEWFTSVLTAVRAAGLPFGVDRGRGAAGSGLGPALRDGFAPGQVWDVDVAFFDLDDLSRRRDAEGQRGAA